MDWNSWGPPLLASGIGLAAGLVLTARARGAQGAEEEAHAVAARREALMDRLRELQLERSKRDDPDWQAEHDALVRQAAEALRRAEALPTPRAGRTAGLLLPMSFLATFSAFGAAVVVWPSSDAGAEVAGLEDEPPASPHGMARQPGSGAPDDPHGMARQAGADLPDDLTALNAMAYAALLQGQLPTAMAAVEKARALAPDDPDARTNLDVMRMNVGMVDRAAEDLGKLVEAYPDRPRPLLWLAFARGKQGRDEEARTLLARVLALQPEGEEATLARQWLAELDPAPAATP